MDAFESFALRAIVKNAICCSASLNRFSHPNKSELIWDWFKDYGSLIGIPATDLSRELGSKDPCDQDVGAAAKAGIAAMQQILQRDIPAPPPSALEFRLNWLQGTLDLTDEECALLKTMVRVELCEPMRQMRSAIFVEGLRTPLGYESELNVTTLARMNGCAKELVEQLLARNRALVGLGLVEDRQGGDYEISETTVRISRMETTDLVALEKSLMGGGVAAQLDWQDYWHLGRERDLAAELLSQTLSQRGKGINILLHGVPGTGKTEFARTLGEHIGASVVFVGESAPDGDEPSRASRISALALLQKLARRAGKTILVMDEADDIFSDSDRRGSHSRSKVFMNRLVERSEAPTIWITNNPDCLGASVVRRMTMAIRFPVPRRAIRHRIVQRAARRHEVDLPDDVTQELAELNTSAAIVDAALRLGSFLGTAQGTDLVIAARGLARATGIYHEANDLRLQFPFDPELSGADCDLLDLVRRIAGTGQQAFSMCLFGLPGTGKSAFARYLAQSMGIDVIHKRASDLLGCFVGQTEKQISLAFEEAADHRAMLVIDEADTLLRDRAHARQTWEVSQVNEMLTWMESHDYPFVCTTNLMEQFDPATSRRFLFKVRFSPMTRKQISLGFERFFSLTAPASAMQLERLTPGDFAVVRRKAEILGVHSAEDLSRMLEDEMAAKPEGRIRRIGF